MRRYKPASVDPHGEATDIGGKTCAQASHGLHVLQPRRTGTHRNARQAKSCRYNAATRPLRPAGLRPRAGNHVRKPIMASTCCNRDAPAHTETHSRTTPLPIHGHAPARTTTHGKRKRVATTPVPVHSSRRGSGRGRENTYARQSWTPRVATETHQHTPRRTRVQHRSPSMGTHRHASPRTASKSVSLQRRFPSTTSSEAPDTGGKTRAHDNHGLHLFWLGRATVSVLRCFQLQWVRCQSIANNSGYRYRLFHSRTKSASLDSHVYVSGWLLCCHEPKYPQVSLHQALSGPDQDDMFCQDLIHCSGR